MNIDMNKQQVRRLRRHLSQKKLKDYYRMLRVVSGPLRFKILVLTRHMPQGMSVTDISRALDASLSRISHQIRILRNSRLVTAKRQGRSVIYSLANPRIYDYIDLP